MKTINDIIGLYNPKNVKPAVERALTYTALRYTELLTDQLRHGKGSDGQDLTPGYLQDPFFKTPQAAMRYAIWKKNNSPSIGRNFNAPNLFITGYYHKSLKTRASDAGLDIDSSAAFSEDISRKYKGKAEVLGGEYRAKYIFKVLEPQLKRELNLT